MRAFIFTDPVLAKHAGQFVWLSIDTEKGRNAAFIRKYPIRAWPSLYVIDAEKERIALRWVGGVTVAQLEKLFADGEVAVRGAAGAASATLGRADGLYGAGEYKEAAAAYREVLRAMAPEDSQYGRVVESLLFSLQTSHDDSECARLARETLPRLRDTASGANLAASGLDCALAMPADSPGRAESVAAFEADTRAILKDPGRKLAADDRSAMYGSLVSAREEAKDPQGALALASEWMADLDETAAHASNAEQRTALDPNRLSAFEAAGQLEKAIPMLERSEKDFPADYNPPARLAYVYLRLKCYDVALAANDRALTRVYGPRRIRVLQNRSDIQAALGDSAEARKTLEDAVAFAESLPEGQRSDSQIATLKKKLETPAH
jgi:predicted negative regulator of RcsB-dependent stress response